MKFKYFTYGEFDSPDFVGSGELVIYDLRSMLYVA